jgi:hypothetical protein
LPIERERFAGMDAFDTDPELGDTQFSPPTRSLSVQKVTRFGYTLSAGQTGAMRDCLIKTLGARLLTFHKFSEP